MDNVWLIAEGTSLPAICNYNYNSIHYLINLHANICTFFENSLFMEGSKNILHVYFCICCASAVRLLYTVSVGRSRVAALIDQSGSISSRLNATPGTRQDRMLVCPVAGGQCISRVMMGHVEMRQAQFGYTIEPTDIKINQCLEGASPSTHTLALFYRRPGNITLLSRTKHKNLRLPRTSSTPPKIHTHHHGTVLQYHTKG
jgi:hypothetical protein